MAKHKTQKNPAPFTSAGIFGRYQDANVQATLSTLQAHLESRGLEVYLGDTTADHAQAQKAYADFGWIGQLPLLAAR